MLSDCPGEPSPIATGPRSNRAIFVKGRGAMPSRVRRRGDRPRRGLHGFNQIDGPRCSSSSSTARCSRSHREVPCSHRCSGCRERGTVRRRWGLNPDRLRIDAKSRGWKGPWRPPLPPSGEFTPASTAYAALRPNAERRPATVQYEYDSALVAPAQRRPAAAPLARAPRERSS